VNEDLAYVVGTFITHRRALGRKYHTEEATLRLLVRFAAECHVSTLGQLTPKLLDEFLASRPRSRPRSFNHLLGIVAGFLDWAVAQELIEASPLRAQPRRTTSARVPFLFDPAQARRLLDAAAALPDNPRAAQRGPTYRTIFALCYGLGLRAGEACGLRLGDVDTERDVLVVVGGKFGKTRLVPHGPRKAYEGIANRLCLTLRPRRRLGLSSLAGWCGVDGRSAGASCSRVRVRGDTRRGGCAGGSRLASR
jgi:integrase